MKRYTKIIAAIMLLVAVVCTMGFALPEGEQTGNASYNGHEYVDLGLPSGTLWATCNVGAGTPEATGYHFAWGDTEPKNNYEFSTYRYINDDGQTAKKYNVNDGLTVLQAGDDAATVNWGAPWHTPTYNEWNELIAYCKHTIIIRNEQRGILFVAPNGHSIFLPAAGFRMEKKVYGPSGGHYWSSSRDEDCVSWCFFFIDSHGLQPQRCDFGLSVRLVCSKH